MKAARDLIRKSDNDNDYTLAENGGKTYVKSCKIFCSEKILDFVENSQIDDLCMDPVQDALEIDPASVDTEVATQSCSVTAEYEIHYSESYRVPVLYSRFSTTAGRDIYFTKNALTPIR